jgi:hypothetical protein
MKRMIRISGYLKYHRKGRLKFDLKLPNLMGLTFKDYDWHEQYPPRCSGRGDIY